MLISTGGMNLSTDFGWFWRFTLVQDAVALLHPADDGEEPQDIGEGASEKISSPCFYGFCFLVWTHSIYLFFSLISDIFMLQTATQSEYRM